MLRGSFAYFAEYLKQKKPAFLDLATAESEEEFELAFLAILEHAVHHMEKNKKHLRKLDEEGLSSHLAAAISIPGLLVVSQEANSNGHVDLTIELLHCTPARIKLGEAKIYSSPSYHMKGVAQLLGRYTTGRESSGLLLNYVRKPNIKSVVERLKTAMDKKLPESQDGPCETHPLRWSLWTRHKHSSGELVAVAHIGCNLY